MTLWLPELVPEVSISEWRDHFLVTRITSTLDFRLSKAKMTIKKLKVQLAMAKMTMKKLKEQLAKAKMTM
jgi:uncharacterized coiled-coil protein SlyX